MAKYKLEKLGEEQTKLKDILLENIMMSEMPDKWNTETVASYINNPDQKNEEKFNEVIDIGREYEVPDYLASILHASRQEEEIETENA